jgi:hypothetical protein
MVALVYIGLGLAIANIWVLTGILAAIIKK